MDGQFSTPLSDLIPSSAEGNNTSCPQFPSNVPQESGVCRGLEISDRTYTPPPPPTNYQGDSGLNNYYTQQQPQQQPQQQQQKPLMESTETIDMPKLITNLQNVPMREYALLIFVIWLIQNDDVISTMVKYLPVSITSGANLTKVMLAVVFAVGFYVLREYLVFI